MFSLSTKRVWRVLRFRATELMTSLQIRESLPSTPHHALDIDLCLCSCSVFRSKHPFANLSCCRRGCVLLINSGPHMTTANRRRVAAQVLTIVSFGLFRALFVWPHRASLFTAHDGGFRTYLVFLVGSQGLFNPERRLFSYPLKSLSKGEHMNHSLFSLSDSSCDNSFSASRFYATFRHVRASS